MFFEEVRMRWRGVSYDVGREMWGNWRPVFEPKVVRRELQIIHDDLHCNAVRICGRDLDRLRTAAEDALDQGLEVWLSPELWEHKPAETREYMVVAARLAESLRQRTPGRVTLVLGGELTLFMRGVVPGRNVPARVKVLLVAAHAGASGETRNLRLDTFLRAAVSDVRRVYRGPLTYASLIFESVDWSRFDIVGVDHYREARNEDQYAEQLEPLLAQGKPVVVTEFGCRGYVGADTTGTMGFGIVDERSRFLHRLPLVGRVVRPHLRGAYDRDENLPARHVTETLALLEAARVAGAFAMTFVDQIAPYDEDPRYDLDMSSFSLVRTLVGGRHGTTYPDMPWEPKAAFRAIAQHYADLAAAGDSGA